MNKKIEDALILACGLLLDNLNEFTDVFRFSCSVNNFYKKTPNIDWTPGFCTGTYWLAYEKTKNKAFRDAAMIQVETFKKRIAEKDDVDHHDIGFLYSLSCVAAYKLTGDAGAKEAGILAADQLLTRFQEKGQFIQAWGPMGEKKSYRLIIDCLLNVPLLYWAYEETGNEKYKKVADAHTQTSMSNLIRPDASAYHTFYFDPETGAPLRGCTYQGYRDGSAWARGQAWGIYGMALSRKYTGKEECVELFKKITDYFIARLPEDGIPYWDLEFIDGDEPRDSSAAAVAACGMLEMVKYLPEKEAATYREQALKLAESLIDRCAVKSTDESNGILLHGVYAKSSPYNPISKEEERGVDECVIWGDYFYMELLTRLTTEWELYW